MFSFSLLFSNLWIVSVCSFCPTSLLHLCFYLVSMSFFNHFPHSTNLLPSAAWRRDNTTQLHNFPALFLSFVKIIFSPVCDLVAVCISVFSNVWASLNGCHCTVQWSSSAWPLLRFLSSELLRCPRSRILGLLFTAKTAPSTRWEGVGFRGRCQRLAGGCGHWAGEGAGALCDITGGWYPHDGEVSGAFHTSLSGLGH